METKNKAGFLKSALCFVIIFAAAVFCFSVKPVSAAEFGLISRNSFRAGLVIGQQEDPDDSYNIEDDLESLTDEAEADSEEDEEADDAAALVAAGNLTPETYAQIDWNTVAIVDVSSSMNARAAASTDADIIGKLYGGTLIQVIDTADGWTQFVSGNVSGYASSDYLLFGEDARAYCDENISWVVTVTSESLNIRAQQSTDAQIVATVSEGDELTWDTAAETEEGWIAVIYNDTTCYVSAEYAQAGSDLLTAMTTEEAKEYEASNYTTSDLDLLAALIYCEAGGESYAGQLAVGAVVMNRVKSSSYPNTISGVIYQSGQFSPASSGKLARVLANGTATSSCYTAAAEALSGVSNIGSCLHFHAGSGSGTQIGNQVFY